MHPRFAFPALTTTFSSCFNLGCMHSGNETTDIILACLAESVTRFGELFTTTGACSRRVVWVSLQDLT
jgi:hypothetical protein